MPSPLAINKLQTSNLLGLFTAFCAMQDTEIPHSPSQCAGIDAKQFCCPVGSVNFTVGHFQNISDMQAHRLVEAQRPAMRFSNIGYRNFPTFFFQQQAVKFQQPSLVADQLSFHQIFQSADIARPTIAHKFFKYAWCNSRRKSNIQFPTFLNNKVMD